MLKILTTQNADPSEFLTRDIQEAKNVEEAVSAILKEVKEGGDAALIALEEKFDKAKLYSPEVTKDEWENAVESTDKALLLSLEKAAENIRIFHEKQVSHGFQIEKEGVVLGQRVSALDKVGIYVPGGTARYPSTVLMNAIPAVIAGVKEIVMVTPPDPDGSIPNYLLAAAKIAGVSRVFRVGGAQAIAALTYGTQSVPKVDKIVGPGNIFVATAKKQVFGLVDIDMIAGPSEILIIADDSANPVYVAADLLSQAEHDRLASAILLTPSETLAQKVNEELERQTKLLPRADIATDSLLSNGRLIVTKDLDECAEIANRIAPEHLELSVSDPWDLFKKIRHAGSVFLGHHTPEALGDYLAGTNHTLPTSGTARFSSPLSVDDFIKKTQFISYSEQALSDVAEDIVRIAETEGLHAHAQSVIVRQEGGKNQ